MKYAIAVFLLDPQKYGFKAPGLKKSNILVEYNRSTIEFQIVKTRDFGSYVGSYSS